MKLITILSRAMHGGDLGHYRENYSNPAPPGGKNSFNIIVRINGYKFASQHEASM